MLSGPLRASPLEGSTLRCQLHPPPGPAFSPRGRARPQWAQKSGPSESLLPKCASFRLPPPLHHQQLQNFSREHKRQVLVFGFMLLRRKTMKRQTLGNQVGGKHPALRSGEMLNQRIEMPEMKVGLLGGACHTRADSDSVVMVGDAGSGRL